jgi:hypothetical protein
VTAKAVISAAPTVSRMFRRASQCTAQTECSDHPSEDACDQRRRTGVEVERCTLLTREHSRTLMS